MPIHLPSLSRRKFISRSILAGAGLVLAQRLFAAEKDVDANAWALLADTHIAADRATASRGIRMAEHLAAVGQGLDELSERPSGLFLVGDCALNSGEKSDYATLTELLTPIRKGGIPVHLALGNHDNRERFWEVLENEKAAKRPMADRQVALLRSRRTNWFVLDSLGKTLSTPGLLGQDQLDWLAKALDENSDKPALILLHHNPGKLANVEGIKDTEALFKVIRPRKQVKAWIFGHTHRWSVSQDESGIHLINLPPVAYAFRDEDPSGWIHATVLKKGIRLELRCVNQKHKANGQVTELKWRS